MKFSIIIRDEPGYYTMFTMNSTDRASMEASIDRYLNEPCTMLCGGCRRQADGKVVQRGVCQSVAIFEQEENLHE